MFAASTMSTCKSDIPGPMMKQCEQFAKRFYDILLQKPNTQHMRLLRPRDILVVVDSTTVYFVLYGGPSRDVVCVFGKDVRSAGTVTANDVAAAAEHQLSWSTYFWIKVPLELVEHANDPGKEKEIEKAVESYIAYETQELTRRNNAVHFNPIFKQKMLQLDPQLCFVLMPFSNDLHLQEVYQDQVKPTIEQKNYRCRRADDIYDNVAIVENIWENIVRARFLIADLTTRNANVFYELGIAHTVGKDVILLAQSIADIPFDLRHLRAILYDTSHRGLSILPKQLSESIDTIVSKDRRH